MVVGATGRNGVTALQHVTEEDEIVHTYVTILNRGITEPSARAQQQNGNLALVQEIAQVRDSQHTPCESDCNIETFAIVDGRWSPWSAFSPCTKSFEGGTK